MTGYLKIYINFTLKKRGLKKIAESEREALTENGGLVINAPLEVRYKAEIEERCQSNQDYLYLQEKYRLHYADYKRSIV